MNNSVLCVIETEKCSVIRSFIENNGDEIKSNSISYSRKETYCVFWYFQSHLFCFDYFFFNVQLLWYLLKADFEGMHQH